MQEGGGYIKERLHFRLQRRNIFDYKESLLEDTNETKNVQTDTKNVQTRSKGYNRGYNAIIPRYNRGTRVKRRLQWGAIEIT